MPCDPPEPKSTEPKSTESLRIFLTGYRGTGKTSVGRILADLLNVAFLDTDHLVQEQCGRTIAMIVKQKGWEGFRTLEKRVLNDTAGTERCVVATGGGIVLDRDNVDFMKLNGTVVWLTAPEAIIIRRITGDAASLDLRPSLTGQAMKQEVAATLSQRTPLYRRAADVTVDTSLEDVYGVADQIKRRIDNGR
ncbi:MAG TPA: shikimate kinase AroL [Desulfobacteraceae bacterium]|nr:shikimate kinase AroL [Desulfobacteraceae bacterium]